MHAHLVVDKLADEIDVAVGAMLPAAGLERWGRERSHDCNAYSPGLSDVAADRALPPGLTLQSP